MSRKRFCLVLSAAIFLPALWVGTAAARVKMEHQNLIRYVHSLPESSKERREYEVFFRQETYDLLSAIEQFLKNPFRRDVEIYYFPYVRARLAGFKGNDKEILPYAEGVASRKASGLWDIKMNLQVHS